MFRRGTAGPGLHRRGAVGRRPGWRRRRRMAACAIQAVCWVQADRAAAGSGAQPGPGERNADAPRVSHRRFRTLPPHWPLGMPSDLRAALSNESFRPCIDESFRPTGCRPSCRSRSTPAKATTPATRLVRALTLYDISRSQRSSFSSILSLQPSLPSAHPPT